MQVALVFDWAVMRKIKLAPRLKKKIERIVYE